MATRSFEKSVKGATKIKDAPPKTKYIEHILVATHAGEAGVGEVFRALQPRLQDTTWTVVFKSLITVHLMVREGSSDVTLSYLAKHRNILGVSSILDGQPQGRNIRHYAEYLSQRAKAYRDTKCDWVRGKESRLEKLTVSRGLLRETEAVQYQLTALLKCDVIDDAIENEITITVFRLLVLDLLALFQALNQGMINILGHFFEMSKPDAERAMDIYRTFTKQTDHVVQYLSVARQFASHTRVEVPKLKHAPVNLGKQLEEYLKDPDFEVHRRQYLAELDVKKRGGGSGAASKLFGSSEPSKSSAPATSTTNGSSQAARPAQVTKGPDPDLIDFFDSIEQNQTPMNTQPNAQLQQQQLQEQQMQAQMQAQMQQQQQMAQQQMPMQTGMTPWGPAQNLQTNGFQPQQTGFQTTNPFQQNMGAFTQQQATQAPMQQPAFTGAGFGGFSPQSGFQPGALGSIPDGSVAQFQRPQTQGGLQPGQQTTNPFRQSMLLAQQTGAAGVPNNGAFSAPTSPPTGLSPQSTNPFARSSTMPVQQEQPQIQQQMAPQQQPQFTSSPQSNPVFSPPAAAPLQPMATGTNPFAKNYGGAAQRPATSGGILSGGGAGGLVPQPTGTTNPFKQGAFVNHQTGLGWQHGQQPIGGGLDTMETVPVFPRPASQNPWQQ